MNLRPDKYFEEMQPVRNVHGNDWSQEIETRSEISIKNKLYTGLFRAAAERFKSGEGQGSIC